LKISEDRIQISASAREQVRTLYEESNFSCRHEIQQFQSVPAPCASYPPPKHHDYFETAVNENATVNIPPLESSRHSPERMRVTGEMFLTPRRRRTTLGTPSRQANPVLSPVKSQTNLRAAANVEVVSRRPMSITVNRSDKAGGMVKLAARNTFRGREHEVVDWVKECELSPDAEMPSPFIRRRGLSRTSAGVSRS